MKDFNKTSISVDIAHTRTDIVAILNAIDRRLARRNLCTLGREQRQSVLNELYKVLETVDDAFVNIAKAIEEE